MYEGGIEEGHLSVLTEQYRDGYVSFNVGNIKPGEQVRVKLEIMAGVAVQDDSLRLRFPFTLAPVYHAKMRVATLDANNYELELPKEEFGDLILPSFSTDEKGLHRIGFKLEMALDSKIKTVSSPSHSISFTNGADGKSQVSLATAADIPNRDLILDVQLSDSFDDVFTEVDQEGQGHLLGIIASDKFGKPIGTSHQVVFVLDRSGSMEGVPIKQARSALLACIGALAPDDKVGCVAFDDCLTYYNPQLVPADNEHRDSLRDFIEKIEACGGTELLMALKAAHDMIKEEGGEIFLITDGQVGGTENIGALVRQWNIKIHILGIGSASQDRFLNLLARQTGGVSRFVSPAERVDLAALDLFASVHNSCALNVRVSAVNLKELKLEPTPAQTITRAVPLVIYGQCAAESGELEITWQNGTEHHSRRLKVDFSHATQADNLKLFRGARLLTDLDFIVEVIHEDETNSKVQERSAQHLKNRMRRLSEEYGLASREMALVAVVERKGDMLDELPKTIVVPVGLPQFVEREAYWGSDLAFFNNSPTASKGMSKTIRMAARFIEPRNPLYIRKVRDPYDELIKLSSIMKADGGLPGNDLNERIVKSAATLVLYAIACFSGEVNLQPQLMRLQEFLE